jgi:septation ring formation regulator EzrA
MDKEIKNEFENLRQTIQEGFKEQERRTDEKIDELAVMVKRGFDEMASKKEMREGFERIDERFERIDERFMNVNARLDTLEGDMSEVKDRLSNVDGHILEIKEALPQFVTRAEFEPVLIRLRIIEKKIGLNAV